MTSPAVALELRPRLAELLDEQFSEDALDKLLPRDEKVPWELWESVLYGPLADFLSRPGKELRARVVDAAWTMAGGRGLAPVELSGIIEALHAGSLIVDDIEDGSAERRGAPALHRSVGLPRALNAGCWLYFWPHALLARLALPPDSELMARRKIGAALMACHSGQALDLGVRFYELPPAAVPRVVRAVTRLKTGTLVELAAALGAIAAGARPELSAAIAQFGLELGVGLQMFDDLSGLSPGPHRRKGHEDLRLARATWPWAWLAREQDAQRFDELRQLGRATHAGKLHPDSLADVLYAELGPVPGRRARTHLICAHERLEATCGKSAVTSELAGLLEELEASYV